jgi:Protein of unknown function (DUF3551)
MKSIATLAACGLLAAAAAIGVAPAAAATAGGYREAPWCAVINLGFGDVQWDCAYRSIEECQPHVIAGNRGFCNLNPRFVAGPPYAAPVKHRKRHW